MMLRHLTAESLLPSINSPQDGHGLTNLGLFMFEAAMQRWASHFEVEFANHYFPYSD